MKTLELLTDCTKKVWLSDQFYIAFIHIETNTINIIRLEIVYNIVNIFIFVFLLKLMQFIWDKSLLILVSALTGFLSAEGTVGSKLSLMHSNTAIGSRVCNFP